jgi:hypothetical protein
MFNVRTLGQSFDIWNKVILLFEQTTKATHVTDVFWDTILFVYLIFFKTM